MKVIVGLGNPGKEYDGTFHNIGFAVIDALAGEFKIKLSKKGFKAVYGEGKVEGQKVLLVKPQTYMNLSGESVVMLKKKFKDATIMVVCDDFDLERGKIRYRQSGSGGTHNGLRNIVSYIGQDFERIRLGIGRAEGDLRDYVLSKMEKDFENELVKLAVSDIKKRI